MRLPMRMGWLTGILLGVPPLAAQDACAPGQSPVLILGTYHMDNPGLDGTNVDADDVRSPRRQAELEELVRGLARFRPTAVLVEAPYRNTRWPERYTAWRKGTYEMDRNEISQVGFRLAAAVGLETVIPVDFPMWMNGWRPDEIAMVPRDTTAPRPAPSAEEQELSAKLRQSTVREYLRWLNSAEEMRSNHGTYIQMLENPSAPGIYARTDEVTNWYKRNLRIYTNMARVTRPGTDRVFLLVGAGHLAILRQLVAASRQYCLVEATDYL